MTENQPPDSRGIAIIGMAGRFPSAENLDAFWRNLADGVESITTFSEEELLASGVPAKLLRDPNYVRKGTVLERPEWFDARFFGYSPREAEVIDPQQRIFLELAWEALEVAGYCGDARLNRIGVFAGASMNSYLFAHLLANPGVIESVGPYQTMLGSDKDFLATRVSYELNLHGPSLTVQTACSTSLVAVQVACQSLLGGQCDVALAGGVSVAFPTRSGYLYTEGMILSNDGHCRPFDAEARGIRAGSGAGIVVLKRLDEAIRDGDSIQAIIRGAAVNNDGSDKIGYTAPSIDGQAEVIAAAQKMAGIDPEMVNYIEAHGTGTVMGDPIEVAALERVFQARTNKPQFCGIGSLKSNIGHLDAAAGVAGLIKTVLSLKHQAIPPSLNYSRPNPSIDFARSPFYVNDRLRDWKSDGGRRIAGVSSFGIGGTNAHVILEEAPQPEPRQPARSPQLLVLSAKTESALDNASSRLGEHLRSHPDDSLADVCYTLQVGRRRFPHRRFWVIEDRERAIDAVMASPTTSVFRESRSRPVAFLFPGQGSQHAGMGVELYRREPVFRKILDECAGLLRAPLGCDLLDVIHSNSPGATAALDQTRLTQPALFSIEYALARLWMSWGIAPDGMIGHSIGEYVAACLAGVFSLSDALSLVAARGSMMQAMQAGAMLAVPLPAQEVGEHCGVDLSVAAVNSPSLCTVSGTERAIAELEERLSAKQILARRIRTSHAFHSAMMDPMLAEFTERVRQMPLSPPRLRYISNLTGTWIRAEEATDPAYWAKHLRHTVLFAAGLQQLLDHRGRILLEVGPGQVLSTFAREISDSQEQAEVIPSLPHPRDVQSDSRFALQALGHLWAAGAAIDWDGFHVGERLHRIPLPTYPFERKRFCVERPAAAVRQSEPLEKRTDVSEWFYVPSWRRSADPTALPVQNSRGPWLVFLDETSLGEGVNQFLAAAGESFVTVRSGSGFSQSSDGCYTLNPARRDDFDALFNALSPAGLTPRSVLHLWNTSDENGLARTGAVERQLPFYSLISLVQAWNECHDDQPLDLLVVSKGLHRLNDEDRPRPEKALLVGPCRVIAAEYARVRCRSIDLPDRIENQEWTIAALLRDFDLESDNALVAYRGEQRWEHGFEPVRLRDDAGTPLLRHGGVYLITGGFGGIGFTLARYLAKTYRARLVLTSRSPLSNVEGGSQSRRLDQLRELHTLGAEVLVLEGDVTDRAAMEAGIAEARNRFGGIHGVVHAAGVAGGGPIQLRSAAEAERVLAPKVEGTLVLAEVLAGEPLDFLVLCSSVSAVYGVSGDLEYCAANAFLDAWAVAHGGGKPPIFSIGWDAWQEVGMAVNAERPIDLRYGILPSEGIEVFRRVLSTGFPQLLVVTRDLTRVLSEVKQLKSVTSREMTRVLRQMTQSHPEVREGSDPSREASAAAGRGAKPRETAEKVRAIWSDVLGMPEIGSDDDFFALGGHSLLATGVLTRIRQEFGVNLQLRAIFEAPTIRALSEQIDTLTWALSDVPVTATGEEREVFEL